MTCYADSFLYSKIFLYYGTTLKDGLANRV
jgi:hypothetical protein